MENKKTTQDKILKQQDKILERQDRILKRQDKILERLDSILKAIEKYAPKPVYRPHPCDWCPSRHEPFCYCLLPYIYREPNQNWCEATTTTGGTSATETTTV